MPNTMIKMAVVMSRNVKGGGWLPAIIRWMAVDEEKISIDRISCDHDLWKGSRRFV